ncbi:hypothetical protein [Actinoplanes sp. NBRC 103695]|nr:hypothetical protein [Actinoplanes sp. NBRC 103695]
MNRYCRRTLLRVRGATGNSPSPALVTTEDGKVVTVTQLDLPQ